MTNSEMKPEEEVAEPANLRFLRRLVTALTATMIGGVLVIIALIVIRFNDRPPTLPSEITLPGGSEAVSFTQGPDWFAITTNADEILIFDRVTDQLRQRIAINPAE